MVRSAPHFRHVGSGVVDPFSGGFPGSALSAIVGIRSVEESKQSAHSPLDPSTPSTEPHWEQILREEGG